MCVIGEPGEIGMCDQDAEWVKDNRGPVLPRFCALTNSLKLSSFKSAAITPRARPCRGALRLIIGVPMLNEG